MGLVSWPGLACLIAITLFSTASAVAPTISIGNAYGVPPVYTDTPIQYPFIVTDDGNQFNCYIAVGTGTLFGVKTPANYGVTNYKGAGLGGGKFIQFSGNLTSMNSILQVYALRGASIGSSDSINVTVVDIEGFVTTLVLPYTVVGAYQSSSSWLAPTIASISGQSTVESGSIYFNDTGRIFNFTSPYANPAYNYFQVTITTGASATITASSFTGVTLITGQTVSNSLSFSGLQADVVRALNNVYMTMTSRATSETLTFSVLDLRISAVSSVNVPITVALVNHEPVITLASSTPLVVRTGVPYAVSIIYVADTDSAGGVELFTIKSSSGSHTYTMSTTTGLTFLSGGTNGGTVLNFTATVANALTAIGTLSITGSEYGSYDMIISMNDLGNTYGSANTVSQTLAFNVYGTLSLSRSTMTCAVANLSSNTPAGYLYYGNTVVCNITYINSAGAVVPGLYNDAGIVSEITSTSSNDLGTFTTFTALDSTLSLWQTIYTAPLSGYSVQLTGQCSLCTTTVDQLFTTGNSFFLLTSGPCSAPAAGTQAYIVSAGASAYPSTATYACNTGYTTDTGSTTRVCSVLGDYSGSTLNCKGVTCGTLSDSHGSWSSTNSNLYPSTGTLTCDTGYSAVSTSATCSTAGSWGTYPSCSIKDCGAPGSNGLTDAHGSWSAGTTTYGATATLSCNTGYSVSGNSAVGCLASASWDTGSKGTCTINSCAATSTIGDAGGGTWSAATITYGSTATLTCPTGYVLREGTSTITCGASSWNVAGKAICTITNCTNIVADLNTWQNTSQGNWSASSYSYGSVATLACNKGFYMSSGSSSSVCGVLNISRWANDSIAHCIESVAISALDPHFTGFDGRKYDVDGLPDTVFNWYTDLDIQVNSMLFLATARNLATYSGQVGIKLGPNIQISLTEYPSRSFSITPDTMDEDGTFNLGGKGCGAARWISHDIFEVRWNQYKITIYRRAKTVYHHRFTFYNIEMKVAPGSNTPKVHGLMGQTLLPRPAGTVYSTIAGEGQGVIEGEIMDYIVTDGLLGSKFSFNAFEGYESPRYSMAHNCSTIVHSVAGASL